MYCHFPGLDYEAPADFTCIDESCINPDNDCVMLGDIVINAQKVREQAAEYGHSELREYAFLVAHSMLHLCGYDHMSPEEVQVMEEHQEKALAALGSQETYDAELSGSGRDRTAWAKEERHIRIHMKGWIQQ